MCILSHCRIDLSLWLTSSCFAAFCILFAAFCLPLCLPSYLEFTPFIRRVFRLPRVRIVSFFLSFIFGPLSHVAPMYQRYIAWRARCWLCLPLLRRPPFLPRLFKCVVVLASTSPEFLALVIQAIQTPISAITQHLLTAAVDGPAISSQGLPTTAITARGSHCPAFFRVILGQSHGTLGLLGPASTLVLNECLGFIAIRVFGVMRRSLLVLCLWLRR